MILSHAAVVAAIGLIPLFSPLALWLLGEGVWRIRRGGAVTHRSAMWSLKPGAMGLAGVFAILPDRIMHRVVFGGDSAFGWVVIVIGVGALIWPLRGWMESRGGRHAFCPLASRTGCSRSPPPTKA